MPADVEKNNQIPLGELGVSIPLESLSKKTVLTLITNDFLKLEDRLYRKGLPANAEQKILFLIADERGDVRIAKTSQGHEVYTKKEKAPFPKAPEIDEFRHAISDHFEISPDLPRVLSEGADVFYNLYQLTSLDQDFESTYQMCINRLAESLGYTTSQAAWLTFAKYKFRLLDCQGEKRVEEEKRLIGSLMAEKVDVTSYKIPLPDDSTLTQAYRVAGEIGQNILKSRLHQLQTIADWSKKQISF